MDIVLRVLVFVACSGENFNWLLQFTSDESEPSWLGPQLELKDFQLGSACDLFRSARKFYFSPKIQKYAFFATWIFFL